MKMPEPEPQSRQGDNIAAQARQEIREEVRKIEAERDPQIKNQQKQQLIETIRQEIKDAVTPAKEAVDNEMAARRGREMPIKQQEANQALRTLIKAVEAAKAGIQVAKTAEGQTLLLKLADQSLSSSVASAIESQLADYLIGDKGIFDAAGQPTQEFQEAFEYLRIINSNAAKLIGDILIQSAGREIPGLSENEAKKFKVEEKPLPLQNGFTYQEDEELRKLGRTINENLNQNLTNLTPGGEEFQAILNFLEGFIGETEEAKRHLEEGLRKIGIAPAEKERYLKLLGKLRSEGVNLGMLESWAGDYVKDLQKAKEVFSVNNLIRRFFTDEHGNLSFTREGRQQFKGLIDEFYYKLLKQIHTNRSAPFDQAMQHMTSAQYYFAGLHQIVEKACRDIIRSLPQGKFEAAGIDFNDVKYFFEDAAGRYLASIMTNATIFHNLPLWARDAENFKEWRKFMMNIFHSQLAEVFDDGGFMEMVRRRTSSYFRTQIVKNENRYPPNLISGEYKEVGVRWHQEYKTQIKEIVEEVARELKIDLGEDDWKLDRALVYAEGIGLATLVDVEVLATSYPTGEFAGIHPLLPILTAKFNWKGGRAEDIPGRIVKYLLGMTAELYPEKRPLLARLWSKKKWVPKKFADWIDKKSEVYAEKVVENIFVRKASFKELLSMVNIAASLVSRGGWRIKPLWNELKNKLDFELVFDGGDKFDPEKTFELEKEKNPLIAQKWQRLWDTALVDYGNAALWWFITAGPSRLNADLKRLFALQKGKEAARVSFASEYQPGTYQPTEKALLEEFYFGMPDGNKRKMSLLEIKNIRTGQLRGEAFFRYMRRDPANFLLLVCQLVPELTAELRDGQDKSPIFNLEELNKLKGQERAKAKSKRDELIERWGEEGFQKLSELRKWIVSNANQFTSGKVREQEGNFIEKFTREGGMACERMMKESNQRKLKIEREIEEIKRDQALTDGQKRERIKEKRREIILYIRRDHFKDPRMAEAILGDGGLYQVLTSVSPGEDLDNFYKKFGDFEHFGEDNFFYRAGLNWTIREGDINPFSSDFSHYEIYKHLGEVGEDIFGRLHGDTAAAFEHVIKHIPELDILLLQVARTGNFEEIYKLHNDMYEALKNIIGLEYAERANYILAQIVGRFFLEHSLARDPKLKWFFPLSLLARGSLLRNISLSKIATKDWHAFSMDTNALRTYFLTLSHKFNVIPVDGAWSEEQLNRVFESALPEFVAGDAAPSFLWFLAAFLLFMYLKKAIQESEGKKK